MRCEVPDYIWKDSGLVQELADVRNGRTIEKKSVLSKKSQWLVI